jgi:hypothetical protein
MTALPHPGRSRAVLIGASSYSHLEDLPAVRNNLTGFRDVLIDPALGGLSADTCTILAEPSSGRDVYRALRKDATAAEDTLLVYFAGHGRTGARNELYLCLPDTDPDELWFTALGYEQLREAVAGSRAIKKVVILDCCFSGRALADQAAGEETIVGQVGIEGTYILTATAANAVALAPSGERYTAFTGTLLDLLHTGIPDGPELLTFAAIYPSLTFTLTSRQLPRPRQQGSDTIAHLALTRNPAYKRHGTHPPARAPLSVPIDRSIVYENLELLFEQADDSCRVNVVRSPSGETPEQLFHAPFEDVLLENLVRQLQQSHGGRRRIDRPVTERVQKFGADLYEALFHDDLGKCLRHSLDVTEAREHGLRIQLRLSDCPALMDVPWEFMYDRSSNRFVCLSHLTPVVRYLHLEHEPAPVQLRLPLRILVMISDPADHDRLDVRMEHNGLAAAVRPLEEAGQLELIPTSATLQALRRTLRDQEYHAFHFIGHVGFDEVRHDRVLLLKDDDGRARLVSGRDIGAILAGHPSLRLAVLDTCEGSRSGRKELFANVAQATVQQGIPAVIAMQFEFGTAAAGVFAWNFYSAIVAGLPVDAALAQARMKIRAEGNDIEWATPVLYRGRRTGLCSEPIQPHRPPASRRRGLGEARPQQPTAGYPP